MIKQVTQGGSVGVKINEVKGDFFLTEMQTVSKTII